MAGNKSKRERFNDLVEEQNVLKADMEVDQATAMRELGKILASNPMKKILNDLTALKELCVPASVAEAQLQACINVPVNVANWVANQYPTPVAEEELPQEGPNPEPETPQP